MASKKASVKVEAGEKVAEVSIPVELAEVLVDAHSYSIGKVNEALDFIRAKLKS